MNRVVITGLGLISSLGSNASETWDNLIAGKQSLFYRANFPEDINEKKIVEYLVLIGSEKPIPFVDEFEKIERLYKLLVRPNLLVEKSEISYIILNK